MIKPEKEKDTIYDLYINTRNALSFLIRKWLQICLVGFVVSLIAVFYNITIRQTYKSIFTFAVDNGNDKSGSYSGIAAQFGIDLGQSGNSAFEGDNLLEMFRSRNLIESTLLLQYENNSKKQFIDAYIDNHNLIPFEGITNFDNSHVDRIKDSIIGVVYNMILTNQLIIQKKDKKSTLVQLEMVDTDERFAQKFIISLSNIAVKFYTEYKTKKARQNIDILQFQADSLIKVVNSGINYISKNNDVNVNSIKQVSRSPMQQKNFSVTVATAVYTEVLKQLEYAKISFRKETPLIQVIDIPVLPLKKMKSSNLYIFIISFFFGAFATTIILLIKRAIININLNT